MSDTYPALRALLEHAIPSLSDLAKDGDGFRLQFIPATPGSSSVLFWSPNESPEEVSILEYDPHKDAPISEVTLISQAQALCEFIKP